MASAIAMMVGGAVLNATTFVGGSYLARYLSGDSTQDIYLKKRGMTKPWKNTKKIT